MCLGSTSNYRPRPTFSHFQVKLVKHDFPFGSVVNANVFTDGSASAQRYRDYFYGLFNMAAIGKVKWKLMEREPVSQ